MYLSVLTCLSSPVCVSELVKQLSVLEELLRLLPGVLISNHELQQEAKLREKVCGVRLKLKETLAASENEKVRS